MGYEKDSTREDVRNTETLRDLAIRITRLPGWRWMAGMRYSEVDPEWDGAYGEQRVEDEDQAKHYNACADSGEVDYPHLEDPATAGCLLALLGENRATRGAVFGLVEATHAQTLGEACARAALALGRWPNG